MARTTTQEDIPDDSNDPWSIVPEAAAERYVSVRDYQPCMLIFIASSYVPDPKRMEPKVQRHI